MPLAALTTAKIAPETETAQRFLTSAWESVDAVLRNLETVRSVRRGEGQDLRGRLTNNEEDLLRAAVVFAGAGLDAAMKQVVRNALPALVEANLDADKGLREFAEKRLNPERGGTRSLARYLTASNPRATLIEEYVYELTGSSLQSCEQLLNVVSALGISNKTLGKVVLELRPLFVARNEISHELDLQDAERHGDKRRRRRAMEGTSALCRDGLEVGQLVLNAVAVSLPASPAVQ